MTELGSVWNREEGKQEGSSSQPSAQQREHSGKQRSREIWEKDRQVTFPKYLQRRDQVATDREQKQQNGCCYTVLKAFHGTDPGSTETGSDPGLVLQRTSDNGPEWQQKGNGSTLTHSRVRWDVRKNILPVRVVGPWPFCFLQKKKLLEEVEKMLAVSLRWNLKDSDGPEQSPSEAQGQHLNNRALSQTPLIPESPADSTTQHQPLTGTTQKMRMVWVRQTHLGNTWTCTVTCSCSAIQIPSDALPCAHAVCQERTVVV